MRRQGGATFDDIEYNRSQRAKRYSPGETKPPVTKGKQRGATFDDIGVIKGVEPVRLRDLFRYTTSQTRSCVASGMAL